MVARYISLNYCKAKQTFSSSNIKCMMQKVHHVNFDGPSLFDCLSTLSPGDYIDHKKVAHAYFLSHVVWTVSKRHLVLARCLMGISLC